MLRFTIRDLLWLMVVVALGCGWFISHRQQAARFDDLLGDFVRTDAELREWKDAVVFKKMADDTAKANEKAKRLNDSRAARGLPPFPLPYGPSD